MLCLRDLWFASIGLASLAAVTTAGAAPPTACAVDFEGLPAGTVVTELKKGAGISGCNENGTIAVTSQNTIFSSEAAIIFDGDCTVIPFPFSECEHFDRDIASPHEDFGGPGTGVGGELGSPFENNTALHKVLILAKDKVDVNNDDLVDDPDDANVPGYHVFDFTDINKNGVTINAVTFQDIDFLEGESPAQVTFTVPGSPTSTISQVDTQDGGVATIPIIGLSGVTSMMVEVKGSSAFAGFIYDEPKAQRACWATFGGFDAAFSGPEGQKIASFGGNVGPPPSGHLNVVKHETGQHLIIADVEVESCVVDELICANSGDNSPGQPGGKKGFEVNVLNFVGTGDLDGVEVAVTGSLIDCGEPGGKKGNDPDRFEVFVDGNEFVSDHLGGGNIQLHPPVGKPQIF
jgi:hypothetical protein